MNGYLKYQRALITILSDGDFHSGEAIGREMGISRTAVWKIIQASKSHGVDIYAVPRKGYRLADAMELLQRDTIIAAMGEDASGLLAGLQIHDELVSTNAYLMSQEGETGASGTVCLAERQLAGRGRRGRTWVSPYGRNIYMSVLWRFQSDVASLSLLSLVAGLAVVRALSSFGIQDLGLKWPNDVIWQRKKLAGILLEVAGESTGPCHVVIGVGINVDMPVHEAAGIDQPWVDMRNVPGVEACSRNIVVARVLDSLLPAIAQYPSMDVHRFMQDWQSFDICYGSQVVLSMANEEIIGMAQGIDKDGALLLDTGTGVRRFHCGDVSLRPLQDTIKV